MDNDTKQDVQITLNDNQRTVKVFHNVDLLYQRGGIEVRRKIEDPNKKQSTIIKVREEELYETWFYPNILEVHTVPSRVNPANPSSQEEV